MVTQAYKTIIAIATQMIAQIFQFGLNAGC